MNTPQSQPRLRLVQPEDDLADEFAALDSSAAGSDALRGMSWLLGDVPQIAPDKELGPCESKSIPSAVAPRADGSVRGQLAEGDATAKLSARLDGVLAAAVGGLGCDAAALYTLDEATTELAMRSMNGLAASRLAEEARPLRGAVADLEAMCGRAVVLEDDTMNAMWRVPEPCAAAACLPVATDATIVGTLWFFCNAPRSFDSVATNWMEIVAGRLAAELALAELRDAHRDGLWSWNGLVPVGDDS